MSIPFFLIFQIVWITFLKNGDQVMIHTAKAFGLHFSECRQKMYFHIGSIVQNVVDYSLYHVLIVSVSAIAYCS